MNVRSRAGSRRGRRAGLAAALALCSAGVCAHGFGQRFDLPLPLWLWIAGAAATIVITFALVAIFARAQAPHAAPREIDLLRHDAVRRAAHPLAVALRALAAFVFVLSLGAGFFGNQDAYFNLIVVVVWVIWWVGMAFVCALVGDLWEIVDPLRTLYLAIARCVARASGTGQLSLDRRYPARWGAWPAVVLFLAFAWAELVWHEKDVPRALAGAVLAYALLTWAGMFVFGVESWRRHADAFAIAFAVLGRFAPLAVRSTSATQPRRLVLRPYGGGLLEGGAMSWSMVAFVLLMLATVTFDGFHQTPSMQAIETFAQTSRPIAVPLFELSQLGLDETQAVQSIVLLAFAVAFLAVYAAVSALTISLGTPPQARSRPVTAAGPSADASIAPGVGSAADASTAPGVGSAAGVFVTTLVPIAVAYHLSHYFSLLATTGQFVVPLASDPFGRGWDLFGTRGHRVDLAVLSPYVYWYGSVLLIVAGHVIAVVAAHVAALRLFATRRAALLSQLPMMALMVAYTSLSLWILAQPIVG